MTAYSKEKLKTILMQNFGGKHCVLLTMWKLWLINTSNGFLAGKVKMTILRGFLYMKQRQDAEIEWRQFAGAQLNLLMMS